MDTILDFGNLIPRFREVLFGEIPLNSAAGFSTSVVLVIIGVTTFALIYAIVNFRKAYRRVSFYKKTLKPYTPDDLLSKREDVTRKMIKNPEYQGIWEEFDESLVVFGGELHNTLDASHFFNVHSLAHSLADNRLIAAIPGLLTAMGVIGTFVGLQVGLGEISSSGLGTSLTGVDEINQGIGNLISSATIAFMTSVWGVGASIIFNFFEKILERNIRSSVFKLQLQIDRLYRRLTPEKSLSDIESHSRESREIMQTLAEKIGERMQEALVESTDKIKNSLVESLEAVLQPSVEALVSNARESSKAALRSLVEDFTGAITSEGRHQSEQMNAASEKVQETVNNLETSFKEFIIKLEAQSDSIVTTNSSVMQEVQQALTAQIDNQHEAALKRDQIFEQQVGEMTASQETLKENLNQMMSDQKSHQDEILGNVSKVANEVDAMAKRHQDVGNQMREAANAFTEKISTIKDLAGTIQAASDTLATDIRNATLAAQQLAEQNQSVGERTEQLLQDAGSLAASLLEAVNTIDDTAKKSTDGLAHVEKHFSQLAEDLNKQSDSFSTTVNTLLRNYAEQVTTQTRERLNQWNQQTSEFTTSMTTAVQALHDFIDELEAKTPKANMESDEP